MKGGASQILDVHFFDALFLQNGPAGAAVDDEEHRSGEIQDHQCGEREQDRGKGAVRRFLLASGSLKEVAGEYGVSYPTVRLRLDRLIQKIRLGEDRAADPYVALIKRLAVSDKVDFDAAKILISEYKKQKETNQT